MAKFLAGVRDFSHLRKIQCGFRAARHFVLWVLGLWRGRWVKHLEHEDHPQPSIVKVRVAGAIPVLGDVYTDTIPLSDFLICNLSDCVFCIQKLGV